MTQDLSDLIGSAEVCRRLRIDRSTLIRRIRAGDIEYVFKFPGRNGAYLFAPSTVDEVTSGRTR